jgi:hypothetical protein
MPGQRLPIRKIRDVLRLRAGGVSKRQIAASLSIGPTAAGDYLRWARRQPELAAEPYSFTKLTNHCGDQLGEPHVRVASGVRV